MAMATRCMSSNLRLLFRSRFLQAQLVRAALEGALADLKQQCPAVVSSRRERSLERALPLIGDALAGESRVERDPH